MSEHCELYRHFDKDGRLLYVGISLNSVSRLSQHKNVSRWYDQIVRIEIERFPSRKEALEAEAKAINEENPVHNTAIDGRVCWDDEYEAQRQKLVRMAEGLGMRTHPRWSIDSLRHNISNRFPKADLTNLPER